MAYQSLPLILPTDPKRSMADQIFLQQVQQAVSAYVQHGVTTARPTTDLFVGRTYFDSALNTTVVWNGSEWTTPGDTTQFSANSFIYGSPTGGLKSTASATNGQLLIGSTGSAPVLGTITAGGGITVENGQGTIKITSNSVNSVSGTSDRITVTPNTGNVNIDIASTYIGQTSITTLGTITTGTWNATPIVVTYGGTGRATLTSNNLLVGDGTNPVTFIAPGTSGNVLTSNGTAWVSQTPTGSNPVYQVTTVTTDTALTTAHTHVIIDASSNTVTVTLPDVTTVTGRTYFLHAYNATFTITVATTSSQQIRLVSTDTYTSDTLASGDVLQVISTGTYWKVT